MTEATIDSDYLTIKIPLAEIDHNITGAALCAEFESGRDAHLINIFSDIDPERGRTNPFDVVFIWDGFGEESPTMKQNIRAELLDHFEDDPEYYRECIDTAIKSFREFADELEQRFGYEGRVGAQR